ncbi:hypothetical protein OROHE_020663 [Orobanche hederae]
MNLTSFYHNAPTRDIRFNLTNFYHNARTRDIRLFMKSFSNEQSPND